jgi:hypothetical protein
MDYGINTYNNFLLSIPKKQAKSYEIDLGQNNGAYDEELLIRYGDNTLNHMKNKNRDTNLNMDDIMKMNEQLRPFQERQPPAEGQLSYAQLCDGIEDKIGKIDDNAAFLTEFEKNLNKAIEVMTNDIFKFFDDTYNEFNPKLLEKYSYLKSKIKEQKDENANLLKQIDFLLQENTQIMDMVYKIGSRLEKLEKKAGIDKPQESYDKNIEDEKSGESLSESENESHSQSKSKSKSVSQNKSQMDNNENNIANDNEENKEENKEEGEEQNEIKEGDENNLNDPEKANEVIKEFEKNQSKEDSSENAKEESKNKSQENNDNKED